MADMAFALGSTRAKVNTLVHCIQVKGTCSARRGCLASQMPVRSPCLDSAPVIGIFYANPILLFGVCTVFPVPHFPPRVRISLGLRSSITEAQGGSSGTYPWRDGGALQRPTESGKRETVEPEGRSGEEEDKKEEKDLSWRESQICFNYFSQFFFFPLQHH